MKELERAERMKLYFGNGVTTATTLMILALLGFIGWSVWGRAVIQHWGRRRCARFGSMSCPAVQC